MSKVVYVNGFGNGRSSTETVGNALGNYYEDIEVFRFSEMNKNPDKIRKASVGADLITHSAGALALKLESMDKVNSALLLGPPLPQSVSRLLYRTVVKTVMMNIPNIGINSISDLKAVNRYSISSIAELTANPVSNFGKLPEIAETNSLDLAIAAKNEGVPATLVWANNDAYFRPSRTVLDSARDNDILAIHDIDGEHDEVVLRPEEFLSNVFEIQNRT